MVATCVTQAAYVALIVPAAHRLVRALTRGAAVHDVEPLRMAKHAAVALSFRY